MAWNPVAPDGAKSVKANGPILLANTEYVEASMGSTANDTTNNDAIRDHYWNVDANLDGRHRYINMPEYTIAGAPVDPVLGASMGGNFYCKKKTAVESPTQQDIQPFYRNADNLMQLLGMHVCCNFDGRTTNGVCTINYAQNVTSVTRTDAGVYEVVFTNDLPSVNYLLIGGGVRLNERYDRRIGLGFKGNGTVLADVKTVNSMKIITVLSRSDARDVAQGWFCCFGG